MKETKESRNRDPYLTVAARKPAVPVRKKQTAISRGHISFQVSRPSVCQGSVYQMYLLPWPLLLSPRPSCQTAFHIDIFQPLAFPVQSSTLFFINLYPNHQFTLLFLGSQFRKDLESFFHPNTPLVNLTDSTSKYYPWQRRVKKQCCMQL